MYSSGCGLSKGVLEDDMRGEGEGAVAGAAEDRVRCSGCGLSRGGCWGAM